MNNQVALIAFFEISNPTSGASIVSNSIYESLDTKQKKIFEIKDCHHNLILNFKIFNFLYKVFYILKNIFLIKTYFKKTTQKFIIIEGASWIGYSYFFIILMKFIFKDIKYIYHSHNVEYEIRQKKNNIIIQKISFLLEKQVLKISDYNTAVSSDDYLKFLRLYKIKTYILDNGINIKKYCKINRKYNSEVKNFIFFPGNYSFLPNQLAIDKIVFKIMPLLQKKHKNIKVFLTSDKIPDKISKLPYVVQRKISRDEFLHILKNSLLLLAPMNNGPGTKIKIIDALINDALVVTNKNGTKGLKILSKYNPIIYKNDKDMINIINHIINKNQRYKLPNKKNIYKEYYSMKKILGRFFNDIKIIRL